MISEGHTLKTMTTSYLNRKISLIMLASKDCVYEEGGGRKGGGVIILNITYIMQSPYPLDVQL